MNKIKRIVKPSGELHMARTTVERIVRELKKEETIKTRKSKNKICYYLPSDWNDEEELEQEFRKLISNILSGLKEIDLQYNNLNLEGKNLIVRRLADIEQKSYPIPESYFADAVPTEPDEDQIFKMIKALVRRSSDKSKQNKMQNAKNKCNEIKQINKKITLMSNQLKTSDENPIKYSKLLGERFDAREKRDALLTQLSNIQIDLELGSGVI